MTILSDWYLERCEVKEMLYMRIRECYMAMLRDLFLDRCEVKDEMFMRMLHTWC
jgi:hypothetical protein